MKAIVFCSHKVALNLLMSLQQSGQLLGVVLPNQGGAHKEHFMQFIQATRVPWTEVSVSDLSTHLLSWLRDLGPDIIVANTFPYRLPEQVLQVAPQGAWNFHAGSLPGYRGPLPLFWQILYGESHAAMTLHQMTASFDAGPIFAARDCEISAQDTHATLLAKLGACAPELYQELVTALDAGEPQLIEQDPDRAGYHPRATQKDLTIDWERMEGAQIERLVRAANSLSQGAICAFRGVPVRLAEVECLPLQSRPEHPAGTVVDVPNDAGLYLLCVDQSCLKVRVVNADDSLCSGERFRSLYHVQARERFY